MCFGGLLASVLFTGHWMPVPDTSRRRPQGANSPHATSPAPSIFVSKSGRFSCSELSRGKG